MFTKLVKQQAMACINLLGGVRVVYNGITTQFPRLIIDTNVVIATADGLGVRSVTMAYIARNAVINPQQGDVFTIDNVAYVLVSIEQDDGVTVEAIVRHHKTSHNE